MRRRLVRLHRGVYAVGHARLTARGRLWAAVLACGGRYAAVVSHRSAAALWEIAPPATLVEVTTLRHSRSTPTVRVHRTASVHGQDIHRGHDGLPVTTVARTLLDLAAILTPTRLERACHQAELQRRLDMTAVDEVLERAGTGRGTRRLRQGHRPTRSDRGAGDPQRTGDPVPVAQARLSRPLVNATVQGLEVDFLWPTHDLVVETDGAATHLTATAFEADRRRDAILQVAGLRVLRVTWRQLTEHPHTIERTLRALLGEPTS
jgi:hypothetical protein